jgi:hypothetical protein
MLRYTAQREVKSLDSIMQRTVMMSCRSTEPNLAVQHAAKNRILTMCTQGRVKSCRYSMQVAATENQNQNTGEKTPCYILQQIFDAPLHDSAGSQITVLQNTAGSQIWLQGGLRVKL